jgi:iron complex outermembrane recepter protein
MAGNSRYATRLMLGVALASLCSYGAAAQTTPPPAPQADRATETVVVTGYRSSIRSALAAKRIENDIVDSIKAEDIGKFPDNNLAESLQRIPGVAIDREGGEGKSITVRGLGPDFTRVRLNGLEAISTTGGKDKDGGANRGRGFDFNVFASELFNSLTVRKSTSSEIEEGSLGATVDLRTARPFDYSGFTMAGSLQAGYNDLSEDVAKRGTFMVSNRWSDGKFGALFSIAYSTKQNFEEGPNSGRWQNAYSAGNAGRLQSYSTNGGTSFIQITPCTTATTRVCNTTEANATNPTLTGDALAVTQAIYPRFLRTSQFITDAQRLGITGSLQYRPTEATTFTFDALHSEFGADRIEYNLEPISFSRNTTGVPQTDIYNYTIDARKVITKASFNDVDIRSEMRFDKLKTTFDQFNFTMDQDFTDKFSGRLLLGTSRSFLDNSEQTTFTFESYNVQGYSYDLTDQTSPIIDFGKSATGCTIAQACYWQYAAASSTTVATNANGDASLIRLRPLSVENTYNTGALDLRYEINDNIKVKFGASFKQFAFATEERRRYTTSELTNNEAAAPGSGIVTEINGNLSTYARQVVVNGLTYLVPDLDKIRAKFDYTCNCTNQFGQFTVNQINNNARANNRSAEEADSALYLQADYKFDIASMPVRGNVGVRYVTTSQTVDGFFSRGAILEKITLKRSYDDVLPAINVTLEPLDNVLVRFAAAKVMSRPTLASLSPAGSINTASGVQTLAIGNPQLNPVRANTFDLSIEWYPDRDTLFTVSVFKKELESWIQSLVRSVPFSETGYDISLLDGTGQNGTTPYTVTQPVNTKGGDLLGYEVAINKPFTFLPSFLSRTGAILNYTHVDSTISYVISSTAAATLYRDYNLIGMSPNSYNATLYYEGERLSGRVSFSHRDGYISVLLPGSSADLWGKQGINSLDAQVSFKFNDRLTMVLEGTNLTDEAQDSRITYNTAQGNVADDLLFDVSNSGRQLYFGARMKF